MQVIRLVGLDVHAAQTAGAMLDRASGEIVARTIRGRSEREVLTWLESFERPWRAVYEAGPTGYGLARAAAERGLEVAVCAPGHIQRHPSERVGLSEMKCVCGRGDRSGVFAEVGGVGSPRRGRLEPSGSAGGPRGDPSP